MKKEEVKELMKSIPGELDLVVWNFDKCGIEQGAADSMDRDVCRKRDEQQRDAQSDDMAMEESEEPRDRRDKIRCDRDTQAARR